MFIVRRKTIFEDVFLLRSEDKTSPKRNDGENKESNPSEDHEDGHEHVDDVETFDVENVSQETGSRNPANIGECQSPTLFRGDGE